MWKFDSNCEATKICRLNLYPHTVVAPFRPSTFNSRAATWSTTGSSLNFFLETFVSCQPPPPQRPLCLQWGPTTWPLMSIFDLFIRTHLYLSYFYFIVFLYFSQNLKSFQFFKLFLDLFSFASGSIILWTYLFVKPGYTCSKMKMTIFK